MIGTVSMETSSSVQLIILRFTWTGTPWKLLVVNWYPEDVIKYNLRLCV